MSPKEVILDTCVFTASEKKIRQWLFSEHLAGQVKWSLFYTHVDSFMKEDTFFAGYYEDEIFF